MRLRLAAAFVGVATLILVAFSFPMGTFVANVERERFVTALERDAFVLAGHAKETLNISASSQQPSLDPYIAAFSKTNTATVVVTDSQGLAISSSDSSVVIGSNFSNRPEVAKALKGTPAVGERTSKTIGGKLLFVAVPVLLGDSVLGSVRLSSPKSQVDHDVRTRIFGILLVAVISLLVAVAAAVVLAQTISRPLNRLTRRTNSLSTGDFSVRADENSGPPEIRNLSRSFNTMASRLGSMIDHQRQFAGAVSHQLRTPLTALRLRLEQAEMSADASNSELLDALEASRTETDRLQGMVEQLLALARLEGRTAETVVVDAALIARERTEVWEPLAAERNASLSLRAPHSALCKALDGALEQVIDNYVDNALSVVPENGHVEIEVSVVDGTVVVDVLDDGPGLTSEQRALAFQRFWRGPGTTGADGTGLGLAIVEQLAIASGGEVMLFPGTEVGKGIRARIVLQSAD